MSLRAQLPLSKSVTSQASTFSTSLTPFLYQTKTLEGQSWDAKFQKPLCRPHTGHRSFCLTSRKSAQANDTPLHNPNSLENTSNVLLRVPPQYRIRVPVSRHKKSEPLVPPNADKIAWQRSLIDKICLEISGEQYNEPDDEIYEPRLNAYEEIAKIFEAAILEVRLRGVQSAKRMKKNRHLYFSNPPQRAISVSRDLGKFSRAALRPKEPLRGITDVSRDLATKMPSEETSGLAVDGFQVERQIHEECFMRELERAQTDDAVWSILETQVFSLIKTIEKRNEKEAGLRDDGTGSKRVASKKPRRRKGQPEQEETHPVPLEVEDGTSKQDDQAGSKLAMSKKPRRMKGQPESIETSSPPPSSSLFIVPQPSPVTIAPEAVSSIVQLNYGRYCLKALQLLRREFPASLYALMILPTIKQLGPISYVLGATSGLYNELLYLKWTAYADLHGMADILEEMRNQGVQQDRVTTAVIRLVEREREAQLNSNEVDENIGEDWEKEEEVEEEQKHQRHHIDIQPGNNTAAAAWWKLRQVQEGWIRLLDNFHAAERLTEEQRLREAQGEQVMRAVEEAEAKLDARASWSKEVDHGARDLIRKIHTLGK